MAIITPIISTFVYGATTSINELVGLVQDTRKGIHLGIDYFEQTQTKRVELANSELEDQKTESHDQFTENRIMRFSRIGEKLPHLQEAIKNAQNSLVKQTWNIEPIVEKKEEGKSE